MLLADAIDVPAYRNTAESWVCRAGSALFNNETADKCGRLFDGATTADGLTPNAVACSSQKSLTKE